MTHLVANAVDVERNGLCAYSDPENWFDYRKAGQPFHVALLVDAAQLPDDAVLQFDYRLGAELHVEPAPAQLSRAELPGDGRLEWTVRGAAAGHGEILARAGNYWAWCELRVDAHRSSLSPYLLGEPASAAAPADLP